VRSLPRSSPTPLLFVLKFNLHFSVIENGISSLPYQRYSSSSLSFSSTRNREVPSVSTALRAEFARGDGRIKKKEDERRKNIAPSETLFVVNFNEATTKRQDLQMLFEPFGELVRIDMKNNYAFVQFKTIEQATKAKETTNGGKLDQSVLTVEYVARQRGDSSNRDRNRRRDRGRDRYDDRRGPPPPPPPMRGPPPPYDRRHRDDPRYYDDIRRYRDRSPPRGRPRSRSRSRSPPPRYGRRSRSPARRYDDRYDDYRRGSPPDYRDMRRGGSPDREYYRGDRERGYRP